MPPLRHSSVQCGVELSPQAGATCRSDAVLVLEDAKGGRCNEGDISDPVAREIADQQASLGLIRGRWGHECGEAPPLVVIDRTTIRIEDLIETVTGPIEQVVVAGVIGVDSTK